MHVIDVSNVNEALPLGLDWLRVAGVVKPSRNGPVLASLVPVTTRYRAPCDRVLLHPLRDANPFFHVMESLWMLAGRRDVAMPALFAKQITAYSDDGRTLNGAYGWRWRQHWNYDQLEWIAKELWNDPSSRRCVLGMWDPALDPYAVTSGSKDVPCNTQAFFSVVAGRLNMTVCNRSNDVIWGAYGANAVHFSILLEYMAAASGYPVGDYYQISNDYHIYLERPDVQRLFAAPDFGQHLGLSRITLDDNASRFYARGLRRVPLVKNFDAFRDELSVFAGDNLRAPDPEAFTEPFLIMASAMWHAFDMHRAGKTQTAIEMADALIMADDWRLAVVQWLERRLPARENAHV
jgi:hypothetical protein